MNALPEAPSAWFLVSVNPKTYERILYIRQVRRSECVGDAIEDALRFYSVILEYRQRKVPLFAQYFDGAEEPFAFHLRDFADEESTDRSRWRPFEFRVTPEALDAIGEVTQLEYAVFGEDSSLNSCARNALHMLHYYFALMADGATIQSEENGQRFKLEFCFDD